MINVLATILLLLSYPLANRFDRLKKLRLRLWDALFFDGTIRLFMTSFLEITLFSLLNLREIDIES